VYQRIMDSCSHFGKFTVNAHCEIPPRKKIPGFRMPRKLSTHEVILTVRDEQRIISMIYVGRRDFRKAPALVYAYSWTDEEYRGIGLSKVLRLMVILYADSANIPYVISLPFSGAMSNPLLDGMNFDRDDDTRYLRITGLNVIEYSVSQLSKRCTVDQDLLSF